MGMLVSPGEMWPGWRRTFGRFPLRVDEPRDVFYLIYFCLYCFHSFPTVLRLGYRVLCIHLNVTDIIYRLLSLLFYGRCSIQKQMFPHPESALASSLPVLQRAGIHNPPGPSDWVLWRKDWVPKSYKECNKSIHIIKDNMLMLPVCRHKYDPKVSSYLKIAQIITRKLRCGVGSPVLNSLTHGQIKIWEFDLTKAWIFLFDQEMSCHECYGRREKSALLRFNGFHLCGLGVTTSKILEILA